MLEALDGFIIVLGTDGHILYTRFDDVVMVITTNDENIDDNDEFCSDC